MTGGSGRVLDSSRDGGGRLALQEPTRVVEAEQSWWDVGCGASGAGLGWPQDEPHPALSERAQPQRIRYMKSKNGYINQSGQATDPASADSWTSPRRSTKTCATRELEGSYVRHVGPIYRFLYSRVGNREDAEDLTGETFLKASRQLDVSRPDTSIAAWLFTVARTVLADHWRTYYRSGSRLPFDDLLDHPEASTEPPSMQRRESERRIEVILRSLPPQHRRVLELRFLHGCSVQEIAQALGTTSGNVKVLQHRALAWAVKLDGDLPWSSPASRASGQSRSPGSPD